LILRVLRDVLLCDVWEQVYSNLGDHNGFYVGPYHICDLPYIFVDNGQFYFYRNTESLNKSGVFEKTHHTIHKIKDGEPPALDLSVTNLVAFQWIAMFFIFCVFGIIARKKVCQPNKAPRGF
jgi:hypothetical protein